MKNSDHLLYYTSLIGILILGIFFVYSSSPDKNIQMLIVIGMSVLYTFLGIVHHLLNHDLATKIVVEYVLIACLGIAVSFFIFKGGFGF